jgi:hypothetical protein
MTIPALLELLGMSDVPRFATLMIAALLGGLVRGFTGFGFAMVFVPLASVVVGPVGAVGLVWAIDAPFALPLAARVPAKRNGRRCCRCSSARPRSCPLGSGF